MKLPRRFVIAVCMALLPEAVALADGINVRIMPPEKAQFLQLQKVDLRVEATPTDPNGTVSTLTVRVDGIDVTSRGVLSDGPGNTKNWTYLGAAFGRTGSRSIDGTATGTASGAPISGSSWNGITVRAWDLSQMKAASVTATFPDVESAIHVAQEPRSHVSFAKASRAEADQADEEVMNKLHLGKLSPYFHVYPNTPEARAAGVDVPVKKAKNVILFIGDGMGAAHRTAGRVLSKGYTGGKANGTLAMDRMPYNGLHMTSSLNSLITDSAPGAHNYSTGNKTNNGMEGVFPDNTAAEDDNPRVEYLSEFIWQNLGKVTGIVSDAFLTDATPAAFLAHTQNRNNGTLIAGQYFDLRSTNGLKVLMGGGSYFFIPKSTAGSRRTDERNVINDFKGDGWTYVSTATELNAFSAGANARLFGLFNLDNMNVAFDKLRMGDASVVADFPDQPFLKDMTKKAIDVLSQYPNGFFLMVEGAHIDKQSHRMDFERAIYDVIQLDQAVQVGLDFALANGETLVIVSADHECSGLALPAVSRPEKKGTRDYVKTYVYSAPRNDTPVFNFTDYQIGPNGYPVNPEPAHKLIGNFGAAPDHYEDWTFSARPRNSSATEGSGFDPGVTQNGVVVANPNDPKRNSPGALLLTGVLENGSAGGDVETQAVHTLTDIPISAYGPGSSQFARVLDNTEAFFEIMNAFLGTYPVPAVY